MTGQTENKQKTLTQMPPPDFLEEFLSFLICGLHFLNFSSETRLTYTSELVNSYEFSKT